MVIYRLNHLRGLADDNYSTIINNVSTICNKEVTKVLNIFTAALVAINRMTIDETSLN